MTVGQLAAHSGSQLTEIERNIADVFMAQWTDFRKGGQSRVAGHPKGPENTEGFHIVVMVLGHLTGVTIQSFKFRTERGQCLDRIGWQTIKRSWREKSGFH